MADEPLPDESVLQNEARRLSEQHWKQGHFAWTYVPDIRRPPATKVVLAQLEACGWLLDGNEHSRAVLVYRTAKS